MSDLKQREDKIKTKRMHTERRTFVREVGSRFGTYLGKKDGVICRYPDTERVGKIIPARQFDENRYMLTFGGRAYDENKTFFQNFQDMYKTINLWATLAYGDNENTEFADDTYNAKNVYLSFAVVSDVSNILYSFLAKDHTNNVLNSVSVAYQSENVYMSNGITGWYNIFFSRFVSDSSNIWFSTNLIGCQECMFCDDLQNQSYCINNKQLDKETYKMKKEEFLKQKKMFLTWYQNLPTKGINRASMNVEGSAITKSHNIENGSIVYQVDTGRNLIMAWWDVWDKHMYDVILWWSIQAEDIYGGALIGIHSNNIYCSINATVNSSNIYYSHSMNSCSYCLGCFGLQNKSFCILNKQYSKEERFELANKIFAQMDGEWTLGDFLPGRINPFYFNDTMAYLIDNSFTKEEVEKDGYMRRDAEIKTDIPAWADVITIQDLDLFQWFNDKGKREIYPEIMQKVIKDDKGNFYRIVKIEYDFLMKYGLPIPEIHWLERIRLWFQFK